MKNKIMQRAKQYTPSSSKGGGGGGENENDHFILMIKTVRSGTYVCPSFNTEQKGMVGFLCRIFAHYSILELTLINLVNFLNGIIHLLCLEMSIINFRDIKMRTCRLSQQIVQSLVRLHRCTGWPGSILVAKADYFRFRQDKG